MTLHWRFISHMALESRHILAERCVEHPQCHRELETPYAHGYPKGQGKWYYFIDDDPAEYASERSMLDALARQVGQ